jgi:hypothetical protein
VYRYLDKDPSRESRETEAGQYDPSCFTLMGTKKEQIVMPVDKDGKPVDSQPWSIETTIFHYMRNDRKSKVVSRKIVARRYRCIYNDTSPILVQPIACS